MCNGCGTCIGVCPYSALEMKIVSEGFYKPVLDSSRCKRCYICVRACPLTSTFTSTKKSFIGNHRSVYIAHSTDPLIRFNASSGGVVASLVAFLFDSHLIDGAVTTKMSENHPLLPKTYIATNKQGFMESSGSKYCPVHVNSVLKQLINLKGNYAFVGLPCHIQGFKSAESNVAKLKDKIFVSIGLFCGHTVNFYGTWFLLSKFGVNLHDVSKVTYRGKGWPGGMTITLKNQKEIFIPFQGELGYWRNFFQHFFFTPTYCLLCDEGVSRCADISVGDAWLPELQNKENAGESIVVARTAKAEKLLTDAVNAGYLSISKVSVREVLRSQRDMLSFKNQEMVRARAHLLRLIGKSSNYSRSPFKPLTYFAVIFPLLNAIATESPLGARLMLKTPSNFLKLYTSFTYLILKMCFNSAR